MNQDLLIITFKVFHFENSIVLQASDYVNVLKQISNQRFSGPSLAQLFVKTVLIEENFSSELLCSITDY